LSLPVRVVGAPVVREADGLAMSSRNRFLTLAERHVAPVLHATLCGARDAMAQGQSADGALRDATARLAANGFATDYIALVENATLLQTDRAGAAARLIAAARLGDVRLLDNIPSGITK
jgi:pantoate--beta-alanine ligase